jgi:hypothetical protein
MVVLFAVAAAGAEPPELTAPEKATVDKLVAKLKDPKTDEKAVEETAKLLAEFGPKIIPMLDKENHSPDHLFRMRLCKVVIRLTPDLALPRMRAVMPAATFMYQMAVASVPAGVEKPGARQLSEITWQEAMIRISCAYVAANGADIDVLYLGGFLAKAANAISRSRPKPMSPDCKGWQPYGPVWEALRERISKCADPKILAECQGMLQKSFADIDKKAGGTWYGAKAREEYQQTDQMLTAIIKKSKN